MSHPALTTNNCLIQIHRMPVPPMSSTPWTIQISCQVHSCPKTHRLPMSLTRWTILVSLRISGFPQSLSYPPSSIRWTIPASFRIPRIQSPKYPMFLTQIAFPAINSIQSFNFLMFSSHWIIRAFLQTLRPARISVKLRVPSQIYHQQFSQHFNEFKWFLKRIAWYESPPPFYHSLLHMWRSASPPEHCQSRHSFLITFTSIKGNYHNIRTTRFVRRQNPACISDIPKQFWQ